jgi:L-seryl-tRNA(Ser) seleniumtransferase
MSDLLKKYLLQPVINASGSVTRLGGAPMPQAVVDAMAEMAQHTVPLDVLQGIACRAIASATRTEAGLVTAGAAAGLTLGAAAILTRWDRLRMESLPDTAGFANEFVVSREHRSGYDHAVRAAGAKLVEVGFNDIVSGAGVRRTEIWEYEAVFGEATAGVLYVLAPGSVPPLSMVVDLAHKHNLPVLVDAAAELPPRSNLTEIAATGADLVVFSGGKSIRGPQSSGILAGRRDLVGPAFVQMMDLDEHPQLWVPPAELVDLQMLAGGPPRHGLGRGLKVSKETIIGLLTALELFRSGIYDSEIARQHTVLERIVGELQGMAVSCTIEDPGDSESSPLLEIALDEAALGQTAFDVCRRLREGNPSIYPGHARLAQGALLIQPLHLDEQAGREISRRLIEVIG